MKRQLFLLDIFSYSCMNCLRSLKIIKKISRKYRKRGLRTVIIHPPEWEFEKNKGNIINAADKNSIKFPIIIDTKKRIISGMNIDFWPSQALFSNGKILYSHIGEGNYRELEGKIIEFFGIKSKMLFYDEPKYSRFPAIYLGKKKNNFKGKVQIYGRRIQTAECIRFLGNGHLALPAKGRIMHIVAESAIKKPVRISLELNGRPIKNAAVNKPGIYSFNLTNANNKNKNNILKIKACPDLAVYSFSFE